MPNFISLSIPPPHFVWCQLRKLGWISAVLCENQVCFHLDHFVFIFELKFGGKDSGLFYLTQLSMSVFCWFFLFRKVIPFVIVYLSYLVYHLCLQSAIIFILVGDHPNLYVYLKE